MSVVMRKPERKKKTVTPNPPGTSDCGPHECATHTARQHVPCLTFPRPPINRNKKVRRPEVAVILWYFVLEHQVISKRVPGEIRQHPVILMAVVPIVRQHDVWSLSPLQLFEDFLDVG